MGERDKGNKGIYNSQPQGDGIRETKGRAKRVQTNIEAKDKGKIRERDIAIKGTAKVKIQSHEPVYLEFMPPEDEILPAEEQPTQHLFYFHPLASTALISRHISNLRHHAIFPSPILRRIRREDDDEDPEEDPANYPADGGDEGDDEDEPSDEDEDDEVDIEADDEEEEHPAPADSTAVALPAIDQALRRPSRLRLTSLQPHTTNLHTEFTARISIPASSNYTSLVDAEDIEVRESSSAAARQAGTP
ncbi:hypothetical protein Tco_0097709 [Tanacetum coccineum]